MSRKKKILIVEDESLLAMSIEEKLKRSGYKVIDIVSTGEEAVEKASRTSPDLIIMDIMLEGKIDGISAVETIHQREHVPVLYLTACHDTETIQRANKTKHSGFMQKPVSRDDLEITVAAILKQG